MKVTVKKEYVSGDIRYCLYKDNRYQRQFLLKTNALAAMERLKSNPSLYETEIIAEWSDEITPEESEQFYKDEKNYESAEVRNEYLLHSKLTEQ